MGKAFITKRFFKTIALVDKNIGFKGKVGADYFTNITDIIPLYVINLELKHEIQ